MARKQSKPAPLRRAGVQVADDQGRLGWRLRVWDPRSNRQPERVFYGTEAQAGVELERWRSELQEAAQPVRADARNQRVATWAIQWLGDYAWKVRPVGANPGVKRPETTWRAARAVVSAYIVPGLGANTTLASLTYEDCYNFVAGLRVRDGKDEARPATKEKAASVLRLMLGDAKRAGVLRTNPAADLPTVWGHSRKKVVVPSLVQVEALAEAVDERWAGRGAVVRLFAYSGLRWEELAALRWQDVDLENRTLHVWRVRPSGVKGVREDTKTEASRRYALVLDQATDPLARLEKFAAERGSEFVLCGERGGPLNYSLWRKHLDKARAASGVPYTAHDLRHVCASLLIAGGATPVQVRDQMGHSRSSVTEQVYRHAWALDRRKLASALSQAVTNVEVEELVGG